MDPRPNSHPLVRGGFSPLTTGNWSGLRGLGDAYSCDQDGNCSDTTTGTPFTVGWVPVAIGGGVIPQWVYIVGAVGLLALLAGGRK